MSEKQILIAHGDKGGVGKSTMAMLCVEALLDYGKRVVVVEGDLRVGDVGTRYAGVDGVDVIGIDLDVAGGEAENAVSTLFEHVETLDADAIVVNAPANAAKALDANADVILPVARDLGYCVCVGWMIGPDEASARLAGESLLAAGADRKAAIVNRGLAAGAAGDEFYPWLRGDGGYRDVWLTSGGAEGELPLLATRVAAQVKAHGAGRIRDLAGAESPLALVNRSIVQRWLNAALEQAVAPLLGAEPGSDAE